MCYSRRMRQKSKRMLQIFTLSILSLCGLLFITAIMSPDTELAWLGIIVIVAAPFILFGLAILWTAYATYPSLVKSLKGQPATISKNNKKHKKQKSKANYKIFPRAIILTFLFGVFLILWFIMRGGPNEGVGTHVFGGESNPYLDMQIAAVSLTVSCVLAIANNFFSKWAKHK